jgi:hypothetical protein
VWESDLIEDVLGLSPKEVREALNSLSRRCLIQSTHEGVTLQNVVMEYVSEVLIHKLINELEASLRKTALMKMRIGQEVKSHSLFRLCFLVPNPSQYLPQFCKNYYWCLNFCVTFWYNSRNLSHQKL